jgi:hypothetical protein
MKATSINKISPELEKSLKAAEDELKTQVDPEILEYLASKKVLERVQTGEQGLYDPENSGDRFVLTMAGWE